MRSKLNVVVAILLAGCTDQSDELMPGQWQVTTRVETLAGANSQSAGMLPTPPPLITGHCLTRKEARRPTAGFLTGNGANAKCSYTALQMRNGRISAMVECADSGAIMRTLVDGRYQATNFDAKTNATVTQRDLSLVVASQVSGRRIGKCEG